MKKLDYIDALRAIAILAVIMVHTAQYGTYEVPTFVDFFIGHGSKGVQLFFVCSAFTLFLSSAYRKSTENSPIRNFLIRRFFRIAPMYYLGILYYLWQDGLGPRVMLGDASGISLGNIVSNFTFLHGINPYWINSLVPGGWSITVEMMFYAVFPFIVTRIKNISHALIFFCMSLLFKYTLDTFLTNHPLLAHEQLWEMYLYFYLPNQLPIFAFGIILYFLVEDKGERASGLSLLFFSLIMIIQLTNGRQLIFIESVHFGFLFLIIGLALSRFSPVIVVNPFTKFIGKLSFSMYLVHFAVLHWMTYFGIIDFSTNGLLNYGIRYFAVVLISSAISSFFYHQVELRFQKLGKSFIDLLERKSILQRQVTPAS